MSKHEFYADPTVFDQLAEHSRNWLCTHLGRLCPFAWTLGFGVLSAVFLCLASGLLVTTLVGGLGDRAVAWNQSLSGGIAVVASLLAAQHLFRLALTAWPENAVMPLKLLLLGKAIAWQAPQRNAAATRPIRKDRRRATPHERDQVQEFFTGVRAAGVNVAIARALFSAGIRSPRQLLNAGDEQLHAIRGVGPATVRKLRAHFRQQPHSSER